MTRLDGRVERLEARFEARFAQLDARSETRFAQLETAIERASLTGIRWSVGLILPLYAVLFGFLLFIVSREFPR
jgi:hypothetical protein